MIDHLLQFDDEAAAIATLPTLRGDEGWVGDVMPVALVTAEAEFGEPGEDGQQMLIAERGVRLGFFLLAPVADLPGEIAQIERETGRIVAGDETLAGARLDSAWAGAEPVLSIGSGEPEPVPDGPTLSDWRVALIQMGRFQDVKAAVEVARDSGSTEGLIAWERFEYANHVFRAELLRLAPVFGFSEAEIDESLRVAAQVGQALRSA